MFKRCFGWWASVETMNYAPFAFAIRVSRAEIEPLRTGIDFEPDAALDAPRR